MNYRLLFQWIPLGCIIALLIAGAMLKQKNIELAVKNKRLMLQNDSILSVNIVLEKQLAKIQRSLDSLRPH
jgi:hypothetical protein